MNMDLLILITLNCAMQNFLCMTAIPQTYQQSYTLKLLKSYAEALKHVREVIGEENKKYQSKH